MKTIFFITIMLTAMTTIIAQEINLSTLDNEKQFDFWIGDWDLEWTSKDGKTVKGKNQIDKILNGKVVQENFDGGNFIGKSWSLFDKNSGMWKQTWVDNGGSYLDFTGGIEENSMILNHTRFKDGSELKMRMIFYDINKNSFKWNWEKFDFDSNKWNLVWMINYKRKS